MVHSGLDRLSVMIVEDDKPSRLGLAMALEVRVGSVVHAGNGCDGLSLFADHAPDVVITDIRMPCMDGLDMIRAIRGRGGDPFVIVTSGFGAEESYLSAIELGVNQFIKKPYGVDAVLAALDRAGVEIGKRKHDAYRRALSDGLLSCVPNCHLLTDGERVLYYADPQCILPVPAMEGQQVGPYMRGHFTMTLRQGAGQCSLPQDFKAWLERHPGREYVLASTGRTSTGAGMRLLLRLDPVRLDGRECFLLTFTDISQIESERERFYQLAGRDFLTGVGNRQAFEAQITKEINRASRYGEDLCLMMLDIDDFKSVNDTFGHQMGDKVLVEMARRISAWVRVTDTVCRYGGEEFMVIMPQTGMQGAVACAGKLSRAIAGHDFGIGRPVTASVGLAQYAQGESGQDFVRRVDMAQYEAKHNGKNRVSVSQALGHPGSVLGH